jgi:hypothetical protein
MIRLGPESLGATALPIDAALDAYAARSGRGPGIRRNDFSAGAKTMSLIRPRIAGNPETGFSAWKSPLSLAAMDEYLESEAIKQSRNAAELGALDLALSVTMAWYGGAAGDLYDLASMFTGGEEEAAEAAGDYADSYEEELSANCFAEGTPVLLGDGSSVAIDALPLGARVQTALPGEVQGSDSSVDRGEAYRLVKLELPAAEGGGLLTIERIMSAEEFGGTPVGGRIYIQLDEHQLFGYAKVLSVEPCPALAEGPGRLVVSRRDRV